MNSASPEDRKKEYAALRAELADFSAKQLAATLGKSKGSVSGYDNGKSAPPPHVLEKMNSLVQEFKSRSTFEHGLTDKVQSRGESSNDWIDLMMDASKKEDEARGMVFEPDGYLYRLIGVAREARNFELAYAATIKLGEIFKEKGRK